MRRGMSLSVGTTKHVQQPKTPLPSDKQERSDMLVNLKVGTKVWLGSTDYPCTAIGEISKVLPTQLVVLEGSAEYRFKRTTGYRIGGGYSGRYFNGIVSAEELVEFEKQANLRAKKLKDQQDAREVEESKRKTLNALFPENVYIGSNEFNDDPKHPYEVKFYQLDETKVRELAKLVANFKAA